MTQEQWIAELERRLQAAKDESYKASREKDDAQRRLEEANAAWSALDGLLKAERKKTADPIPY